MSSIRKRKKFISSGKCIQKVVELSVDKEVLIKLESGEDSVQFNLISEEENKGSIKNETIEQMEILEDSNIDNPEILSLNGNRKESYPKQDDEEEDGPQEEMTHFITVDNNQCEEVLGHFAGENFGKFCCIECRMNFPSQDELEKHMFTTHLDESDMSFRCIICGFTKEVKKGMRMHFHQHTSFRPFQCPVCSLSFLRHATLRFHMRTHKKRPEMDHAISEMLQQSNLEFFKLFRITKRLFVFLLRKLEEDNVIRRPKSLDENTYRRPTTTVGALLMALSYIGRRPCFEEIADAFGSCESACHRAVWQVIYYLAELSKKYIRWKTFDGLKEEEKKFKKHYDFPGIVGVIGTCPINIRTPEKLEREKFSHWSCHKSVSVQVMAVCDSKGKFLFVAVGNPGSESEELVLSMSPFGKRIDSDPMSLFHNTHFHLVGSDGFALRKNLLVPIRGKDITPSQILYNKRLFEAKATIEKSFYYMKGRSQRLALIENNIDNVVALIMACCVLHNLALCSEEDMECLIEELDEFCPSTATPPFAEYEKDMEAIDKRDLIVLNLK